MFDHMINMLDVVILLQSTDNEITYSDGTQWNQKAKINKSYQTDKNWYSVNIKHLKWYNNYQDNKMKYNDYGWISTRYCLVR